MANLRRAKYGNTTLKVSERQEQRAIVDYLRLIGAEVYVLGTVRRKGDHPGTMQTPGIPDLWAFLPAGGFGPTTLWIEVKRKGGKRSPAQEVFAIQCDLVEQNYVCGGLDDVMRWCKFMMVGQRAHAAGVAAPEPLQGDTMSETRTFHRKPIQAFQLVEGMGRYVGSHGEPVVRTREAEGAQDWDNVFTPEDGDLIAMAARYTDHEQGCAYDWQKAESVCDCGLWELLGRLAKRLALASSAAGARPETEKSREASVPQEGGEFTAEQVQRHIDRLVPFTAEASGYDNPIISEQVAILRAYARLLSPSPAPTLPSNWQALHDLIRDERLESFVLTPAVLDSLRRTIREAGQPKAGCPTGKHNRVGANGPCRNCGQIVRCSVAAKAGKSDCQLNNLQCAFPECLEPSPAPTGAEGRKEPT